MNGAYMLKLEIDAPNKKADYAKIKEILGEKFECWITNHTFSYAGGDEYWKEYETGTSTIVLAIYQPTTEVLNKLMEYLYG